MNEIKCPKCGTVFQINETDYASIVKQVRDSEFNHEMELREHLLQKEKDSAIKLAISDTEKELNKKINEQEIEITKLKSSLETNTKEIQNNLEKEFQEKLNQKELMINDLQSQIKVSDIKHDLVLKEQMDAKEKEIDTLNNQLNMSKNEYLLKPAFLVEKESTFFSELVFEYSTCFPT